MVAVQFVPAPSAFAVVASPALGSLAPTAVGDLSLESVYLVVDEFKLEGDEGACEAPGSPPDCAKFDAEPHLLALNLAPAGPDQIQESMVDEGTYTSLKFETKWAGNVPAVVDQIAGEGITDWPSNASMMVTGSFLRDGSTVSEPFRVFFDAEVKIVMDFPTPLVIPGEEETSWTVSIEVDPEVWFAMDTEWVDLPAMNFDDTQEVYYLEVKLEDGFTKIEFE
jgi:hypothetical protein